MGIKDIAKYVKRNEIGNMTLKTGKKLTVTLGNIENKTRIIYPL